MAIGDQDNMLFRLRSLMPVGWLPDLSPIADGLLSGFAFAASHVYALLLYTKNQTRIATASDGWLDLLAYDFFGLRFMRRASEPDSFFRIRVVREILRPRATRAAVIAVLTELLGQPPYLYFEPANPTDTGGWGRNGHMGYAMAGRYGSLLLPYQAFVIPIKPAGAGIPGVQGYQTQSGDPAIGGYTEGAVEYGDLSMMTGVISDNDIYAAIESVRPAGTVIWVSPQTVPPESFLDIDAIFDRSLLA